MIGYRRSLNILRVAIVHNGERGRFFCFPYSHDYYTTFFLGLKTEQEWFGVFWRAIFFSSVQCARKEKKTVNLQALPLNSKRNENK
jgi:hypothetical protein